MSKIYSVLILNKNMLSSFAGYKYLFDKAIEDDQIGICKWIESGDTVESALPELISLIDDKEEWKAIIVAPDTQENGDPYTADLMNPFDYSEQEGFSEGIEESRFPLVRLTQMLGGVPAPDISFTKQEMQKKGQVSRIVYTPVIDYEAEERHRSLVEKYRFNAPYPTEIVVISLRMLFEETREAQARAADSTAITEENDFWKKNRYPDICRFVVFDVEYHGETRRNSDMLEFWLCVLLLATNHIKPSSFQAYRIYKISLQYDKDLMRKAFQNSLFRIRGAREYINDTIMVDVRLREELRTQIPDYAVTVPVNVDFPPRQKHDPQRIKLLPQDVQSELRTWNNDVDQIDRSLEQITDAVNDAFDRTSDAMRDACTYPEANVYDLSDYQYEEMTKDLAGRFKEIMRIQQSLPQNSGRKRDSMKKAAARVREGIKKRISRGSFFRILGIVALLIIASNIPLFIYHFSHKGRTVTVLLIICALIWGLYLAAGLITAIIQKASVNRAIRGYQSEVNKEFSTVKDDNNLYNDYMSGIATHSRGASFLYIMRNKKRIRNRLIMLQHRYLDMLSDLQQHILSWSAANYITLNTASQYAEKVRIPDDMTKESLTAKILGMDECYDIPINYTGDTISSPFNFIERMELIREVEYEDGR